MENIISFNCVEIGIKEKLFCIQNLSLKCGKLYSLIGRNAAGKSTFFQSLLGNIKFKDGVCLINGKQNHLISQLDKAKLIAYVASKFDGVQHLTGFQYVMLGRAPYTNFLGKTSESDKISVDLIFDNLEINHLKEKDTSQMSDGERQILSIAKALAQNCKIILLDEPAAFLDYANRIKVLSLLKKISVKENLCIIQSSHDLELCLEFSSDFLIINSRKKELFSFEKSMVTKNFLIENAF